MYKTYQEELRIPPGTGKVGEIKYTDDGLAPLVWSIEDTSGLFTIEDGVIKTKHVFDYETEDTVYVVKVKVEDGEFADSANRSYRKAYANPAKFEQIHTLVRKALIDINGDLNKDLYLQVVTDLGLANPIAF